MQKEIESTGMVGSLQASLNVANCWKQNKALTHANDWHKRQEI